jgi:CubicO group peptidase (beta-lactamase class C family)
MRPTHLLLALCFALTATLAGAADEETPKPAPPANLEELRTRIAEILTESKTPGMVITLVNREGVIWSGGVGLADVASNTPATAETLFRTGSTAKGFVALAALRLQAEGRLDLNATLKSLAPEIAFENPWEATDPVRVVHLLEHTAGFDDIHLKDYWNQDPRPDNLADALAHDPDSRTSRWKPGTRMSYCNSGPAVVAYLIRKITGMPFEDYIAQSLFQPLGMTTATYFPPAAGVPAATLYRGDGVTPYDYWHIAMRPAGATNASANDMARWVALHLGRGRIGETVFLSEQDMARMERPGTWFGARAGLITGYGLHNYTAHDEAGWLWHGHNGGVQGGASDFSYNLDAGVGYAFMINATNGSGFPDLTKLVRAYLMREAGKPPFPSEVKVPDAIAAEFDGWYLPVSPRPQLFAPLERVFGVARLKFVDGAATFGDALEGDHKRFVSVTERALRREDRVAATLGLLEERDEGQVAIVGGTTSFVRSNVLIALAPFALFTIAALSMLVTLVFATVWSIRTKYRGLDISTTRTLRVWPWYSSCAWLAFVVMLVLFMGDEDLFTHYALITPYSVLLAVLSVVALLVPLVAAVMVLRHPCAGVHRGVYGLALVTVLSQAGLMLCMAWWGAIPFITWA